MKKILVVLLLIGFCAYPLFAQEEEFMQSTRKQEQKEKLVIQLRGAIFLKNKGNWAMMNDSLMFYTTVIDLVSKRVLAGGTKLPFEEIYRRVEKGVFISVSEIRRKRQIILRERKNLQEQIKALKKIESAGLQHIAISNLLKKYNMRRGSYLSVDEILFCLKIHVSGENINKDVVSFEELVELYKNGEEGFYKEIQETDKHIRNKESDIQTREKDIETIRKKLRELGR